MRTRANVPTGLLLMSVIAIGLLALVRPGPTLTPGSPGAQGAGATQPVSRTVAGATSPNEQPELVEGAASELDPSTPPAELLGDCDPHYGIIDRMPMTVEETAARSTSVVRGTVEAIGKAHWNTPDGKAPDPKLASGLDVMRLIRVTEITSLAGAAPSTIVAWVPGGTIGCIAFTIPDYDIHVGQDYVFFLAANDPNPGLTGTPYASEAWPVVNGTVETPTEGKMTVASVASLLATSK